MRDCCFRKWRKSATHKKYQPPITKYQPPLTKKGGGWRRGQVVALKTCWSCLSHYIPTQQETSRPCGDCGISSSKLQHFLIFETQESVKVKPPDLINEGQWIDGGLYWMKSQEPPFSVSPSCPWRRVDAELPSRAESWHFIIFCISSFFYVFLIISFSFSKILSVWLELWSGCSCIRLETLSNPNPKPKGDQR